VEQHCSLHDIAEKLLTWIKTTITHSLYTPIPRFGDVNMEHLKNKGNACTLNMEFGPVLKHFL